MKINERGYWENDTPEGHEHDEGLSKALVDFFKKEKAETVIDIGCGTGYYTRNLIANGIHATGVDGNPNTPIISYGTGKVADFTTKQDLGRYDWVLCLEVGEHISQEFEKIFLDNLDRHNINGIVLSWAVRGQNGDGHINCLDNIEVIQKMEHLHSEIAIDYYCDLVATNELRDLCAKYPNPGWWFRNTLMIFRRNI